jgi:predicted permease
VLQRHSSVLRAVLQRREFERCMDDELRFHVERYTEDLIRSGLSQEEAARRARIEFGAANSIAGECREARGLALFDELARNLRYTLRLLKKSPVFTATALLTLALCLGANLAIFAVVDSILLRPLPFPDAGRLVTIFNTYPKAGVERDGSSMTNYYERRGRIPAFSSLSIYRFGTAIVGEAGSTVREEVTQVSPDFFTTLQTPLLAGRAFTDQETTFKTDDVVIITDAYRQQHFTGDAHVIGRHIRVNGAPKTVIGVLPPGFRFLSSPARLYFPLASRLEDRGPSERHSGGNVIQMIARLRPGATVAQAQSQIDAQNAALERDDPQAKLMADAGFRSLVVPLHADQVASVQPVLLLLQAFVLLLLVIGIVNLINLLLIRANGRTRELAMRQALGARGTHIVIDAIVETMLLALTGGIAGIAVGAVGVRLFTALGADHLPLGNYIALSPRLIAAQLAASVAIAALLALPVE